MKAPGKLPPLPALRAFEAAARLGSISAAADELHVTHSAVSQQVKSLEEALGVKLFARAGRQVALTAAGRELALGANEALGAIARTTQLVRQRANPKRLTVTTIPSFAACWLSARIGRFMALEPDVEFRLISTGEVLDFTRDGIDVAIRWSVAADPAHTTSELLRDEMLVVASPDYLAAHPLASPAQLAGCALLRADDEAWRPWFARAGLDWPEPESGLFFNDSALALRWAQDGRGVVLTRRSLADESLRAGVLRQVFPLTVAVDRRYWFMTAKGLAPTPLQQRFRDWLFSEARDGAARLGAAS